MEVGREVRGVDEVGLGNGGVSGGGGRGRREAGEGGVVGVEVGE